jgi:uncharacterized membrane protein
MALSFARRLRLETPRWVRDGLVSAQQAEGILARYPLSASWFSRPIAIFSIIGGALLAGAVALMVAHNWNEIHRWIKLVGLVAILLSAYAWGFWLRHGGYPRTGEGLFVLGGGLWLVGIALIGQLFNLSGRPSDAVLLWWALLLPAAYALPSIALIVVAWLGATAWYWMLAIDRTTWLGRDVQQSFALGIVAVAIGGILLWVLGVVHGDGEYRRVRQFLEQIGLLLIGGALVPFGTFGHAAWRIPGVEGASPWPMTLVALLALATVALAVAPIRLPADGALARAGIAVAFLLVVLYLYVVVAVTTRTPGTTFRLLAWVDWALIFVVGLALILCGARWERRSWINWGIIWIGVDAVARYVELFGTMLQTSALFFATGVFVLLLGWALELVRRRLTARAVSPQRAR